MPLSHLSIFPKPNLGGGGERQRDRQTERRGDRERDRKTEQRERKGERGREKRRDRDRRWWGRERKNNLLLTSEFLTPKS